MNDDLHELKQQIEWFNSLLDAIVAGRIDDAADAVCAAIKTLERQVEERTAVVPCTPLHAGPITGYIEYPIKEK